MDFKPDQLSKRRYDVALHDGQFRLFGRIERRLRQTTERVCDLPMEDRRRLFSQALVPLLGVQFTLPSTDESDLFFGMPPHLRRNFMRFFPHFTVGLFLFQKFQKFELWTFQVMENDLIEVKALMQSWRPNFVEYALIQAMIVFRSKCVSP